MTPPRSPTLPADARRSDAKAAFRRDVRQRRHDHVARLADRIGLETALVDRVRPHLVGGGVLASYAAQGAEIAWQGANCDGPCPVFPRVTGDLLVFHACDPAGLVPGFAGVLEPPATAMLVAPDIVLVPLLAATPDGRRLGQGGGFYDRTLALLRRDRPILAIGLAWDVQITQTLPTDPWDQRLDLIATPTRLVECAAFR